MIAARASDGAPEIHDSNGLRLWTSSSDWIWRPLNNPRVLRLNSFAANQPRGFGLVSTWVRFPSVRRMTACFPREASGCLWSTRAATGPRGSVSAFSRFRHATPGWYNIGGVLGDPERSLQVGEKLLFAYQAPTGAARIRSSQSARVEAKRTRASAASSGRSESISSWRFVVDFKGGNLNALGAETGRRNRRRRRRVSASGLSSAF